MESERDGGREQLWGERLGSQVANLMDQLVWNNEKNECSAPLSGEWCPESWL